MPTYTCPNPKCRTEVTVPDWLNDEIKCPACKTVIPKTPRHDSPSPSPEQHPDVGPSSAAPAALDQFSLGRILAGIAGASRLIGLFPRQNKLMLFGLVGAVGCLLGAVAGQIMLWATGNTPSPQAICLVIDCSGSMNDPSSPENPSLKKLTEVKAAAKEFCQQASRRHEIAVVGFGSLVHPESPLTQDQASLERAVDRLADGGSTQMPDALKVAAEQLGSTSRPRNVLLFTDGMPQDRRRTVEVAAECRRQGTNIIAIATGDPNQGGADVKFLEEVTADRKKVIPATGGVFVEAFRKARDVISPIGTGIGSGQTAAWTALVTLGLCLALIAGQNAYLRRPLFSPRQLSAGTLGGLGAGFVAGLLGAIIFLPFGGHVTQSAPNQFSPSILQSAGTIVGWLVLGALVGRGTALFVPNLAPSRSWIGGALGGLIGSIAYLMTSFAASQIIGRFLGAAVLGLAIGLLVALVEAAFRSAWLEVSYGPEETIRVNLGSERVSIGSDSKACTVFAFGGPPVALRYRLVDGKIECQDAISGSTTEVQPGDRRVVGNVAITVRSTERRVGTAPAQAER